MPKVKATNAYKIQFILKKISEEFIKSPNNELYCNLFKTGRFFFVKGFLGDSYRKTSNHQKALCSRSKQLIPYTLQPFLKSSNTDFVKKVTKAFLSAAIPLYKLNKMHIKNLFCDIGHSLPSETICRRTVLQLNEDELQRIRNASYDKQSFLVVHESTLSGTPYLNILDRSLETPHVSYLYDCQPLFNMFAK